ncbi:MAG: DinB family protein [Candidatus Heimdallarchaeota archaeon]|nr:DinB family protein [Candidatus Heimdallarchaeota archaeon]
MPTLLQLYSLLEEERSGILERFTKVDTKHFYHSETKKTWSAEELFRHILMSNYWLLDNLPGGEKLDAPKIALSTGEEGDEKVSIDEIRDGFILVCDIIKQRLSFLGRQEEAEVVDSSGGKKTRHAVITGFIFHELRHLGQIIWLFKRSTGWTDEEIYKL